MSESYSAQPGSASYPPQNRPTYGGPGTYTDQGYQHSHAGDNSRQHTAGTHRRKPIGVIGWISTAVGAVLLIVSFTALAWYRIGGRYTAFSDFHRGLSQPDAPGFPKEYFGWLGWLLLVIVIVSAVLARLPIGSAATTFRILAPVAGIVGIVVTLLALNNFWDRANRAINQFGIFKHSTAGLYIALIGFLVAGLAGLCAPRRA